MILTERRAPVVDYGRIRRRVRVASIALAVTGLAAGNVAWALGRPDLANGASAVGVIPVLAVLACEMVLSARRGNLRLDIVAVLAMTAALLVGETLAAGSWH
ncbi:hypothetical protein VQ042_23475 [Aurantimonas sp. A2-1-M11]|uniref:hypothetical protein n=1 Tax=Aurantimonas sp. A2-1-M11 TaxID=3113712 RepID=UPI002F941CAB